MDKYICLLLETLDIPKDKYINLDEDKKQHADKVVKEILELIGGR